jgi:hypothetical protein
VSKLLIGAVPRSAVTLRFDYRGENARGTPFALAEQWFVATDAIRSSSEGLGYALLRVADSPGAQPIGGERAESSEQLRQWIRVPDPPKLVDEGGMLLIAGHPEAKPLQISMGHALATSPDEARLRYNNNTSAGSSGAPCFTGDLELVGMHLGDDQTLIPRQGFGVPMAAIAADLYRKGLGQILRTEFV